MDNENWEEMKGTSSIWLPSKAGESIEGAIIALSQGQYGVQASIENKSGVLLTPSHKVLQARLADCKIDDVIKIIFEREDLPTVKGRQGTKIYKVLRKPKIDVPVEKI